MYNRYRTGNSTVSGTGTYLGNSTVADPDPAFHFDADPDPAFQSDADPDPTFQSDADGSGSYH